MSITNDLREEVARIIDPIAFSSHANMLAYCLAQGDPTETAQHYADDTHKPSMDRALAKADAILSLPALALRGEGEEGGSSGAESARTGTLPVLTETPRSAGWRDLENDPPPARKGYVRVQTTTTYRWHPYKPEAVRQLRKLGRWQRIGEFGGWDNAELPEGGGWQSYDPGSPRPAETQPIGSAGEAEVVPQAPDEPCLSSRNRELEEALRPFAEAAEAGDDSHNADHSHAWESPMAMAVTYGDFRRARALLPQTTTQSKAPSHD